MRHAAVLAVLLILLRLPVLSHPQPIDDEVVYAVAGNAIAAGGDIYTSAIERKPPLLLWTYAAMSALSGPYNAFALHLFATLWIGATLAAVYRLGSRLFGPHAGLVAAVVYAIYQQWGPASNEAFNGEVLMHLPLAWAYATALVPGAGIGSFALAGLLTAAASLLKQPAAVGAIPLVLLPFHPASRVAGGVTAAAQKSAAAFAGFAALIAAVSAWLAAQGLFSEAVYWTILDHDVPHIFWRYAFEKSALFLLLCSPMIAGACLSIRDNRLWRGHEPQRAALALYTALAAVGTAASGRFYPHYYIALVLPLAWLSAPALSRRMSSAGSTRTPRLLPAMLALTAVGFVATQWLSLARVPVDTDAGRYVREHSTPDARLFVWGRGTRLYLDAQRRPASRYIATFPLTGRIFGSPPLHVDTTARIMPGAWRTFQDDLRLTPPDFIVDMEADATADYPIRRFDVLRDLLRRYQPVYRAREGVVYRRLAAAEFQRGASDAR